MTYGKVEANHHHPEDVDICPSCRETTMWFQLPGTMCSCIDQSNPYLRVNLPIVEIVSLISTVLSTCLLRLCKAFGKNIMDPKSFM